MSDMPRSHRAVFRLPWVSLAVPVLLFVCIVPLATAGGWWGVAFAVPAAALLVVLFAGTSSNSDRLTARWFTGRHRMAWPEVDTLEFRGARWAMASDHSGRRMRLPGVRPRDLPRLVAASGGRLNFDQPEPEPPDVPPPADPAAG